MAQTIEPRPLTNLEILAAVLGWQGGTVHQVAKELAVTTDTELDADADTMRDLIRAAQKVRNLGRGR